MNRFANALIGLGLNPGDRVAVMLPNSIESFTVPYAVERAGLVHVRLNSAESAEEWAYVLEDSGSVAVILASALVGKWRDSRISDDRNTMEIAVRFTDVDGVRSYESLIRDGSTDPPEVLVGHDDIIAIGYTSGTTGRPKGVMSTFGGRLSRIRNDLLNQTLIIDHNDVILTVVPLTHAAGIFSQLYALRGATNVVMDKFDAEEVLATIEREKVTAIFLVPTTMFRLVNHPNAEDFDLSSLRRVYYGTAPIAHEVLEKFSQLVGPSVLRQQYGATEHPQPIAFLQPEDHCLDDDETSRKRLRSVGRVALGVELRLIGGDGNEVGPGHAGEIQV